MATTYERLRADIITDVKARDTEKATRLRTADAAIQKASIDGGKPIDDAMAGAVVRKLVKNLADAKEEFARGNRPDLVAANEAEIKLLEAYLPAGIDPAKLDTLIASAIAESGAQGKKDMGKVMGLLKKHPDAALIDFSAVSKLLQAKLP